MTGIVLGGGGINPAGLTAIDANVVSGKTYIGANGQRSIGTMNTYSGAAVVPASSSPIVLNNIFVPSLTVPALQLQNKIVLPATTYQDVDVVPDTGKYLSKVTVKGLKSTDVTPIYIGSHAIEVNPDNVQFSMLLGVELYLIDGSISFDSGCVFSASVFKQGGLEANDALSSFGCGTRGNEYVYCDAYNITTHSLYFSTITSGGSVRIVGNANDSYNKFKNTYTYKATLYYV